MSDSKKNDVNPAEKLGNLLLLNYIGDTTYQWRLLWDATTGQFLNLPSDAVNYDWKTYNEYFKETFTLQESLSIQIFKTWYSCDCKHNALISSSLITPDDKKSITLAAVYDAIQHYISLDNTSGHLYTNTSTVTLSSNGDTLTIFL